MAILPGTDGTTETLAQARGCTGIRGLRVGERLADVLERDPFAAPAPVLGAPATPTYPSGWVTLAAEAGAFGLQTIRGMLDAMPQYEAQPIQRCIKLHAFDPFVYGWLRLYAQIKGGLIAAPSGWLPPYYSDMVGAVSGAAAAYDRALIEERKAAANGPGKGGARG